MEGAMERSEEIGSRGKERGGEGARERIKRARARREGEGRRVDNVHVGWDWKLNKSKVAKMHASIDRKL